MTKKQKKIEKKKFEEVLKKITWDNFGIETTNTHEIFQEWLELNSPAISGETYWVCIAFAEFLLREIKDNLI